MPDQSGRVAVVTGANGGLGFETARMLAAAGAHVVLACRDEGKAAGAVERIGQAVPGARLGAVVVDLGSLESVRRAAGELGERCPRIDLLVNNAGGVRQSYAVTGEGYEATFAVNHLGPFAFTGLVLDRMLGVPGSRVVTVSSIAHRRGTVDVADLDPGAARYRPQVAYAQAKLANLLFTYELQRRLAAAGAATVAVAAHPGNARTGFGRDMAPAARLLMRPELRFLTWWFMQDARVAALAPVRAAVDPEAGGGDFYGPAGLGQFTGHPVRVEADARAHDQAAQARLWAESERLTGVRYPLEPVPYGPGSVSP